MLIALGVFLFVTLHAWAFLLYRWRADDKALEAYDRWIQEDLADMEERNSWVWGYLIAANARRKRIGRALKKERALTATIHRLNTNLLKDINFLLEENKSLISMHRTLAAEVADHILTIQDRETVTKGLTRKL
jgi:hypothetical protein